MSEAKKGELAIRDKAILHQQRRLKQATQFTHKDSADLLPLDGLKRLGTSKDLQPHSIVQRRLLEGNITRLRGEARDPGARVRSPLADTKDEDEDGRGDGEERSESTADSSAEEREESLEDEEEAAPRANVLTALLVQCKCCGTEVKASLNTSSPHNHISASCCHRLGLPPSPDSGSSVRDVKLQLGTTTLQCSALVQDDETFELSLGLQTLLQLQCCLDLNSRVLKLGGDGGGEELPFLSLADDSPSKKHNQNL
ncbi:nuclear receptor-interacting protein 2 [Dunckerocampus dactyliophorus]|uniref:nuclear receptor-interacting protein 2 n=1 Tax=Dunckerocampus dactyliophorus TaxID=161453 RepID=UPI002405D3A6|nr:nuclear receptor-interacting protein 2 [Dunckerocampus dactyliophorus]